MPPLHGAGHDSHETASPPVSFVLRVSPFRLVLFGLLSLAALVTSSPARSQLVPGSMSVRWDNGAPNCATSTQPPLQVHQYNEKTYILRENLCATFEAPFMYLLLGSTQALLIDTGDVADPDKMPLAITVMGLLPGEGSARLSLLVVHTHRHLDHRAGDGQFSGLPNVEVVGYDLPSVQSYYNFPDWPNGLAHIDLGDRIVDVIPTPGHNETEVSFYDRSTGLFFTGDFLMPGRLLIADSGADLESAKRAAAFIQTHPVSFVLGGHIEFDSSGQTFPWQSKYHPGERVLQMSKADVFALPAALSSFNGFYSTSGQFVMINSIHILLALTLPILIALILFLYLVARLFRHFRSRPRDS